MHEPNLTILVLSDIHLKDKNDMEHFKKSFTAINRHEKAILVVAGDLTQDGEPAQLNRFFDSISESCSFNKENILLALGNHDVRGPYQEDWTNDDVDNPEWFKKEIKDQYLKLNQEYSNSSENVYFSKIFNGYRFIILNTEKGMKDVCYLSDEQLAWLESELALSDPHLTNFIISHQPLRDTHWRSNDLFGFGRQDKKVKEILTKYPNNIVISGHIHNGFGSAEIIDKPYGTLVDVPSFFKTENGLTEKGVSYRIRVYDDQMTFEAINLLTEEVYQEYTVQISLPLLSNINCERLHEKADLISQQEVNDLYKLAYDQAEFEKNPMYTCEKQAHNLFGSDYRAQINTIIKRL